MDKEKHEHTTPLTPAAIEALTEARGRAAAIGDTWIFPEARRHGAGNRSRSRNTFQKWWWDAERLAKLDRAPRLAWHSLRRQFVTDLKHIPLKDLCALGGWRNPQTVLTSYMHADEDTMRRALDECRTVRAGSAG